MKKIGIFCLIIGLLFGLSVQYRAVAASPDSRIELDQLAALPKQSHIISIGLSSSTERGTKLDDRKLADIGDPKHGISLIGIRKGSTLLHPVSAISDGVWSKWQAGENNEYGNLSWTPSGDRYTVQGDIDNENGRYLSLLTYNFGAVMELEGFGYFTDKWDAMPRTADLYTGFDGVHWDYVGTYDGNQMRMNGKEFRNSGSVCYPDSLKGTVKTFPVWSLDGCRARYLRIAIVNGSGAAGSGTYESYSNNSANIAPREAVVFGTPMNEIIPDVPSEGEPATYRGVQVSSLKNEHYQLRFIGVIQNLQGSAVGFQIQASFGEGRRELYAVDCKSVYQTILGMQENEIRSYTAESLGGKYVYALSITGIPVDAGEIVFTVTPYKIIDGESVFGKVNTVIVNSGTIVSQTVN